MVEGPVALCARADPAASMAAAAMLAIIKAPVFICVSNVQAPGKSAASRIGATGFDASFSKAPELVTKFVNGRIWQRSKTDSRN
jgi:hypothetical protein